MKLTRNKPTEHLPPVDDDDKIRLWQASQTVAGNSGVKIDSQERNISPEDSEEGQPGTRSRSTPQETSKKMKKKKAKTKKAGYVDMLQNAGEG